ncbi:restriction endonuclease subunit S [Salmonella enterica subsp. salamae]|nr:restriction endonuclease subunit S [Salmonella enterica subsp. salamae]
MGNKWKRVTVADVCISIVDCVNKTAPVVEYPTNYKMIRTPNIRSGKVTLDGCRYVEKKVYETWTRRSKPQKEDVLLTREAPLGEVGIITTDENIFLGQRIMQYRADKNKIDPYFLLYSFLSPDLQQQFSMHEGSGSVVSHIRVGDCSKFEINIPPLEIQRSIVEILKSLDDHIDVNIKINQTLEQMSQTLFKSWFVNFDPVIDNALDAGNPIPEALQSRAELRQKVRNSADLKPLPADIRALFPAEFEETELGWVPKGWQPKSMHDLVESVSITFPLGKTDKVIFLNTGDIEKGSFLHQNYSKTEGLPGQAKKSIKKGDILFSEIRPENKRYAFVHFESDDYVVSTKLMVLRAKNEINPLLPYFIITLEDNTKKLQRVAELRSGTFPQITFKELEFISFIMPNNDKIMELFINSYLTPAYNKIIATKKANMNLINLRDTLLPKLISGELSLEDLPNLVDQTEPA